MVLKKRETERCQRSQNTEDIVRHHLRPARFFSFSFSFSIAFCSARSLSREPNTRFKRSLYVLSLSFCFLCCSAARKRASLRSSRIAPLRSCLYCALIFAASFCSWSGSRLRR